MPDESQVRFDRIPTTRLSATPLIEGFEFKEIILLGNLRLHRSSTNYTDFHLNDGTGRILVRLWHKDVRMDLENSWLQLEGLPYARVIGEVGNWNNSNYVTATKLELAPSPYEPYHHILQAIHDTIAYERGPPSGTYNGSSISNDQNSRQGHHRVISGSESTESSPNNISKFFDFIPLSQSSPTQTSNASASKIHDNAMSSIWKGKGKASYRSDEYPLHPSRDNYPMLHSKHGEDGLLGTTKMHSFFPSSPPYSHVSTRLQNLDIHKLYSHLPSLDRDILDCISIIKGENSKGHWKGVDLPTIVASVLSSRTDPLTIEEFTESFDRLIEEAFIFASIDDDHYDITLSPA
ncbi:hypothetical protein E4T56_gene19353 [Termitomyces sp. T112]|nr:hypothetical protein E4T56_gene19353 [Termitomyces sp. T112]